MKTVYVCSPYRGDVELNIEKAKRICRKASLEGNLVLCPHLLYPRFLDDNVGEEREIGIRSGLHMLDFADEVWVLKGPVSEGMARELAQAKDQGIPIIEVDC